MKSHGIIGIITFFLIIQGPFLLSAQNGAPGSVRSDYWDDIELIDGQVLWGVVVDTVKERAVIQLTTRDFISLPETSIRKIVKAKDKKKTPVPSVPAAVSVSLELTAPSPERVAVWKAKWAGVGTTKEPVSRIELEDGRVVVGIWVETEAGHAVIVLPSGEVTGVARSSIRRVVNVQQPAPSPVPPPSTEMEAVPPATEPDLLGPFVETLKTGWEALNGEPAGFDAAGFRTFAAPTALTLKAGSFNLSQLDVVGTQLTYGITDNLQVQAGTALPALVFPQLGNLVQTGVQFSLAAPSPEGTRLRVSGANWFVWSFRGQDIPGGGSRLEHTETLVLPFLLTTFSTGVWDFTSGLGLSKPLSSERVYGLASISAVGRFARHWALVAETGLAWEPISTPENWLNGVYGLRFWNPFVTVDFGVQILARYGSWGTSTPSFWWEAANRVYHASWQAPRFLPVLNFSFNL